MQFLLDRLRGKSFVEATGYENALKFNDSKNGEKEIERLKNMAPFKYI